MICLVACRSYQLGRIILGWGGVCERVPDLQPAQQRAGAHGGNDRCRRGGNSRAACTPFPTPGSALQRGKKKTLKKVICNSFLNIIPLQVECPKNKSMWYYRKYMIWSPLALSKVCWPCIVFKERSNVLSGLYAAGGGGLKIKKESSAFPTGRYADGCFNCLPHLLGGPSFRLPLPNRTLLPKIL